MFKQTGNPLLTNRNNGENTNKIVKHPSKPIIGSKLRRAFKRKTIKRVFTFSSNSKLLLC